jgi:signal transduction histidine kinase
VLTRKLFQSTIFRLTLLYAIFFCASVIALLTFFYFATVREVESQIKHRITVQVNQAQAVYNAHGIEELKRQILEFLEEEDEGLSLYLLVDAQNKPMAGNMENWPEDNEYSEGWLLFDIDAKNESGAVRILARDVVLKGGYHLLVGYSLKGPERTKKIMLDVIAASILLTFLITAFGGALFSNIIKRRLERVNLICAQVISGNIDVKVPVTGSDDEFDHLASNVNAMLDRITKLVTGLRQTSDNIAHDLRTPLNRHRIRLEGLIKHPPSPSQFHEGIKAGMEEIDTIVETLNSILRISQAESGVASDHFIAFDLSSVMIDVVEFYAELAEQKHIIMTEHIHPDIIVMGDKPLLTQAIANLIDNAIKYTPKKGEIVISLIQQEHILYCVVQDNGPGIPPELYEKVKERFFRMEDSRTSPGTGLGLSLVDAVATLHRGELLFENNQPGLRVILTLPIAAFSGEAQPSALI